MQSLLRGCLARRRVQEMIRNNQKKENSAIIIQKAFRQFLARKQIEDERRDDAAVVIQQFIRAWLWRRQCEKAESSLKVKATPKQVRKFRWKKVLKLRTGLRGFMGQRSIEKKKIGKREHSMVTQEAMKGYIICKQMFDIHHHMERRWKAVIVIQTAWRNYLKRKGITKQMLEPESSEMDGMDVCVAIVMRNVTLVTGVDGQADKIRDAAVVIQSHWRGFSARHNLSQSGPSVRPDTSPTDMENPLLSKQLHDKHETVKKRWKSVLALQSGVRGFVGRRSLSELSILERGDESDEVMPTGIQG
ncbi:abnormal spindle-like microcephaly-associated protein homolog [Argopecten irradians]|uniref:abnormal spindle-like microcephaly-associated protein homolog n=1 Tax=Argopecten irradians TaxID=31199 RepID=UPI003718666E